MRKERIDFRVIMKSIPSYQHQAVRDLAWSCFGPNLIDTFPSQHFQSLEVEFTRDRLDWFQELDQNPEPLLTHLSSLKSRRLGLYFEALWKFFLIHDQQLELIAHNVPIRNTERTLGELDVLYRDRASDECIHLELSVKFYLNTQQYNPTTEPADFLGPNCRDRLDKKLNRLITHQCPLSDTPEAKQVLAELGVGDVQKRIAIKGQLFYHGTSLPSEAHPLSVHHQKGYWLHLSDFQSLKHGCDSWVILDKPLWLSPATIIEPEEHSLLSTEQLTSELREHFNEDQRPRMVCLVKQSGAIMAEMDRLFITPNHWPDIV